MSLFKAARIDKKIIAHLAHGGSITDVVAESLISGLIRESLENKAIANAVAFHRIPVFLLVRVYQESFQELLPSPLIRHGKVILVPSLPFIDEDNFPIILDTLCGLSKFSPDNPLSEEMFVTAAVQQAVIIRDQAAAQGRLESWPPPNFPTLAVVSKRQQAGCLGCLGVLVVGLFVVVGVMMLLVA